MYTELISPSPLHLHNVYKLSRLTCLVIIASRLYRIYLSSGSLYYILPILVYCNYALFARTSILVWCVRVCVTSDLYIIFFFLLHRTGWNFFKSNTNITPQEKITIYKHSCSVEPRNRKQLQRPFFSPRLNSNIHAVIALNRKFFYFYVSYSFIYISIHEI